MKLMDNKDGCMQQLLEGFGLHIKALIQKALVHKIRALEKAAGSDNFLDSEYTLEHSQGELAEDGNNTNNG